MRIGVNTLFLVPGEVGGSQIYLCETLRAMAEANAENVFVLFTQYENDAWLRERFSDLPNLVYARLNFRATFRVVRILREQTELPRRARRARLDVLWSPGYTAPICCAVPQVASILDMQYRRFPHDLTPLARWVTHLLVRQAARRVPRILTISEFSKTEIVTLTKAPPASITVTPLAVSPAFAEPIEDEQRRSMLKRILPDGGSYLLCVAHSYPHKNLTCLIKAFGLLSDHISHRLVLVGKPRRGEPALQRELNALPEPKRITRIEQVAWTDLVALYQGADCFIFPSLYEGFGLPFLEAMASGAPVVAADIPAAHEIGGDRIDYFDGRDPNALARAIRRCLDQPSCEHEERIRAARRHALQFSWAQTAKRTLDAFNGTVRPNPPNPRLSAPLEL